MTAKEYIKNYGSDYESEGAMFLFTADELIKFIGNYAIMKCKEQNIEAIELMLKTLSAELPFAGLLSVSIIKRYVEGLRSEINEKLNQTNNE